MRNLTRREKEIAQMVLLGHRNKEVARSLSISVGTVKVHLHNIYKKLGIKSRPELTVDREIRPKSGLLITPARVESPRDRPRRCRQTRS